MKNIMKLVFGVIFSLGFLITANAQTDSAATGPAPDDQIVCELVSENVFDCYVLEEEDFEDLNTEGTEGTTRDERIEGESEEDIQFNEEMDTEMNEGEMEDPSTNEELNNENLEFEQDWSKEEDKDMSEEEELNTDPSTRDYELYNGSEADSADGMNQGNTEDEVDAEENTDEGAGEQQNLNESDAKVEC